MDAALGLYRNVLPSVVVDQVEFRALPDQGINKVEIELLYQVPGTWSRVAPYRVMVILSDDDGVIKQFMDHEPFARHCIADDAMEKDEFRKMYLEGDISGDVKQFDEPVIMEKKTATTIAQRRERITLPDLRRDEWPNLYIYAVAYKVNPQDVTQSGVSTKIRAIKIGYPAAETIYVENRASAMGIVYRLGESVEGYGKKGDIWSGPVHRHGDRVMAGPRHTAEKHPYLVTSMVSNQKMQDKSFMDEQGKLISRLTNATLTLNRRMTKDLEVMRNMVGKASTGVSDIYFSRTRQNVLKGMFAVNYKQFVQANTRLNFLFANKEALNNCFEVEDIRLFRTRIRPNIASNALTPGKLNICGVKAQSAPKLVASQRDGTIVGVQFANQAVGVTNYVATDDEVASQDGGTYEYTLEISAVDHSVGALQYLLHELKKALVDYDKWTSSMQKGQRGSRSKDVSRRLKSQGLFLRQNAGWKGLLDTYLACVVFIFGQEAFGNYSITTWRKNLLSLSNPSNGNLSNIEEVGELVRSFYSALNQVVMAPTLGKSSAKFSVRSRMSTSTATARRIRYQRVFPNTYENTFDAQTGFDYLDDTIVTETPTLGGISHAQFQGRLGAEISKFKVEGPNASQVNKAGFLTPKRINTPTNIIDTATFDVGLQNTMDLIATKVRPTTPKLAFQTTVGTEDPPVADIDTILGTAGISIIPLAQDINTVRRLPTATIAEAANLRAVDSSTYLSSGSVFVRDGAQAAASISGSAQSILHYSLPQKNNAPTRILSSGLVGSLVNGAMSSFNQDVKAVNLEGVAGSLAAQKAQIDPGLVPSHNLATTGINLNAVKRVEYFNGYEASAGGVTMVDQPRWALLTEAVYELARQNNTLLLCRLQETTNVTSGGNILQLPDYDNLFLVGDTTKASTERSYVPYGAFYGGIQQLLQGSDKETSVNVSAPIANVPTWQITTPLVAAIRISDKEVVSKKPAILKPIKVHK